MRVGLRCVLAQVGDYPVCGAELDVEMSHPDEKREGDEGRGAKVVIRGSAVLPPDTVWVETVLLPFVCREGVPAWTGEERAM